MPDGDEEGSTDYHHAVALMKKSQERDIIWSEAFAKQSRRKTDAEQAHRIAEQADKRRRAGAQQSRAAQADKRALARLLVATAYSLLGSNGFPST